jgi:hypothetical protein
VGTNLNFTHDDGSVAGWLRLRGRGQADVFQARRLPSKKILSKALEARARPQSNYLYIPQDRRRGRLWIARAI